MAVILLTILSARVGGQWGPVVHLDQVATDWAYTSTYDHPARTHLWLLVSGLGQPDLRLMALLAGAGLLLIRREWVSGVWLVTVAALEVIAFPAAKVLLDRPRPSWEGPVTVLQSASYPSAHAAAAGTAATAAILLATVHLRNWAARALVCVALTVSTLCVAASRVFLGVHSPTDVTSGLLLGVALTTATWPAAQALRRQATASANSQKAS